jgi:hypothetical protein
VLRLRFHNTTKANVDAEFVVVGEDVDTQRHISRRLHDVWLLKIRRHDDITRAAEEAGWVEV